MRIVVQRVSQASVTVGGEVAGRIGRGLLVLLGVARTDVRQEAEYLAGKVAELRLFSDDAGKMNLAVGDVGGALLVVSQFTLYGDCRKGRRPSFDHAADPETARNLYEYFVELLRARGFSVETGVFQASMSVALVNEGPVTLILESN